MIIPTGIITHDFKILTNCDAKNGIPYIVCNQYGVKNIVTVSSIATTEIPCLLKIYLNEKNERLLERIVKIVMVIISLLGCLYVFKINEVNISGSSYQVNL